MAKGVVVKKIHSSVCLESSMVKVENSLPKTQDELVDCHISENDASLTLSRNSETQCLACHAGEIVSSLEIHVAEVVTEKREEVEVRIRAVSTHLLHCEHVHQPEFTRISQSCVRTRHVEFIISSSIIHAGHYFTRRIEV